jgi:hypothetical protein
MSGRTVWAASNIKRCRKLWRRISASKMGQMLKDLEKRSKKKYHPFGDGEKMATGIRSPFAQRLLVASPHPLTLP